jgi:hypothetical protein
MNTYATDALTIVAGLGVPVVVALVTRPSTKGSIKATLHGVLSGILAGVTAYAANPDPQYAPTFVVTAITVLSGTAFYQKVLKKYPWFAVVQNTLVKDAGPRLHTEK